MSLTPDPFRTTIWRSPLRGPWLTSVLGSILLLVFGLVALTGFASHLAYEPDLGRNAIVPADADLPAPFGWPASPSWLYAVNQGLHVNLGLVSVPFLLAKLWSVIPRLFAWPPVASPAQALERATLGLLVGGAGFLLATGIANAQYWYPFGFNFVVAHYYAAIVFTAALVVHVGVKAPIVVRAYRDHGLRPLRDSLAETRPEAGDPHGGLVPVDPDPPTISRRGVLAFAGGGALALLLANAGQSIGGPLRQLAFLAPRRQDLGSGPNDFAVNKTARAAGITPERVGDAYRLVVRGAREVSLSRADLLALPQHSATLPIACVEGWSVERTWTGVPLAELARLAGIEEPAQGRVLSLQERGVLRDVTLNTAQVRAPDALLALRVEGADLSLDHGFPARVIVPAAPGVHCTKWVGELEFRA